MIHKFNAPKLNVGIRHKVRATNMMQLGHGLITNASNNTLKRKGQETYAQVFRSCQVQWTQMNKHKRKSKKCDSQLP